MMKLRPFYDLLGYKVIANLQAEVARLYLNYVWWVLEPAISMAVYYLVVGVMMNRGTPDFILFLLIGTTQWQWFSSTVLHAASSILNAKGTMQTVDIPKIFFPLEIVLQDSVKNCFVIAIMTLFICIYPIPFSWSWFALPIIFVVQFFFIATVSIFAAAFVPFIPDLRIVISSMMTILMFVSGVFIDLKMFVLPEHLYLVYLNPMAGLLSEYRSVIMNGAWPDFMYLGKIALATAVLFLIALKIINRFDRYYPRLCQQ